MKERNRNVQIVMILAIIAAAFIGNALIFSALSTDALRVSAETETNMLSSVLVEGFESHISPDDIRAGTISREMVDSFFQENGDSFRMRFWITDADGNVCYDSGEADTRQRPENVPENGVLFWMGRKNVFYLAQDCCIVRPLYGGAFSLTLIHQGRALQAVQRRQLMLLIGLDFILMGIITVLIVNIIIKYRREIIRYATTDELTGLRNRKSFNVGFREFMDAEHIPESSLFLLDIDFFKQINDNYGHAAGDRALQLLSERIQVMARDKKGFAGRWGGDEFIGVLPLSGEDAW